MRNTLQRIAWALGLFLLLAIILSAIEKKKKADTVDLLITIEHLPGGNDLITEKDVMLALERSFGHTFTGLPQGALDLSRIEQVLDNEAFILKSEVYIDASNRLNIRLEQREPIVRIVDNAGVHHYMDKNGIRLPMSKNFTARVLLTNGNIPIFNENEKSVAFEKIWNFVKIVIQDPFLEALTEQIYIHKNGDFILVPKIGRQEIIFGKDELLLEKLNKLKIYYKKVLPNVGWNEHKAINLKFKNQIVCENK